MAVRTWSLTRLWAMSVAIWLTAGALTSLAEHFESLALLVLAIAFSPAFLAGSWAEQHPEIAAWPRFRIIAMWTITAAAWLAVGDTIDAWRLPAAFLGAPVAILTLRWYELTRGGAAILPPASSPSIEPPPDTPTGTPAAG